MASNVNNSILELYESAIANDSEVSSNKEILMWISEKKKKANFVSKEVPLNELNKWSFDNLSGNLLHKSGGFFSVAGVSIETNWGENSEWTQPIIDQREIGILGIICKPIGGVLHFLMQAKLEPGNINQVQISPTLQATMSNITQKHEGAKPSYLEYFQNINAADVILDQLQSEQGGRFFKKRNRNIIIKVTDDIEVKENFIWMTLGQIKNLLKIDNIINMDSRSVIACISFFDLGSEGVPFANNAVNSSLFSKSYLAKPDMHQLFTESLRWITELKSTCLSSTNLINLNSVQSWINDGEKIEHCDNKYFSIIGVRSFISSREVVQWDQPMYKPKQEGIIAFIIKPINGNLSLLMQAKVEVGNIDLLELAPTVQTLTGSYKEDRKVPFLSNIVDAPPSKVICSSMQSEEGGRFYQESNYNCIVMEDENFDPGLPENFKWIPLNQILFLLKFNNYLNMSTRSLLSQLPIERIIELQ
jgi:oxidase EvaA